MEQYKYVLTGAAVPTAKRRVRRFLLGYLPTAYCPELTHREKKPVVLAVCVPQSCGLESPIGPLAAPTLKKPQGNIEKLSHTVSWEVEGCQPKPNERCLLSSLLGRDQPWAANERRSHTGGGSSSRMRADAPALLAFLTLTSSPGPGQSSTCHAFQISDWEHSYGQARPSRSCALPCSKRYTPPSQQPRQRAWFGNAARDFHWTTPHPVAAQLAAEATQAATTRQGPIGSARSWQPELHQPAAR
eukprot:s5787_g3.t3